MSSSSSSEDDRRRRRKKDKGKEKEKRSKSKERERRERKERKREKKERRKEKKKAQGSAAHWGKYGIISELDIYNKGPEFHTWLVEERKINPETISKEQSKKEFARFVEDFNTATLPHEKYYNIETYERRMNALRAGEFLPPAEDTYDPDADMKELKNAFKKKKDTGEESYLSREQLMELRQVQNERIQAGFPKAGKMKLLGMDIKQNMGVRMDGSSFDD
ncbi:hypothetical protein AAF712_000364 [Marasmius tenuissimus]|uniref:Uncharacterized protein n=1 Tax=Marasmius tenuissimus TaxID=585030 RepID=A0ABR3AGS8_9AGAR